MSVSSSSSGAEPRGVKRVLSAAQFDAICAEDIDTDGTAAAVVNSCLGDLQLISRKEDQIAATIERLQSIATAVHDEKRARYGETFQCCQCKLYCPIAQHMRIYGDNHHSNIWCADELRRLNLCDAEVCYECAMKCGLECPKCKKAIRIWLDGPVPYLIVMDKRCSNYAFGKPTRLEKTADITVAELAELMDTKPARFRIGRERCTVKKANQKLSQFGIDTRDFTTQFFRFCDGSSIVLEQK